MFVKVKNQRMLSVKHLSSILQLLCTYIDTNIYRLQMYLSMYVVKRLSNFLLADQCGFESLNVAWHF
jgi:hypothetical protein